MGNFNWIICVLLLCAALVLVYMDLESLERRVVYLEQQIEEVMND